MKSAVEYVGIAEEAKGAIKKPVGFGYIWGDSIKEFTREKPDVKIINLETAVTSSGDYWPGKGINYRMNPENIPCLTAAKIDFCSIANNHILDWGYAGMQDTINVLEKAGIKYAGAGKNEAEAEEPAVVSVSRKGNILVFSYCAGTSGVPPEWAASKDRAGVNMLTDLSGRTVLFLRNKIRAYKKPGDIVIFSVHWGHNRGYEIPNIHTEFARLLIDNCGVDVIHGHSSHHPKAMEVYKGKLILYGCGDFINDYEGISGYEEFRSDLCLMYFATIVPVTGALQHLNMIPMQIKHFKLNKPSKQDVTWLCNVMTRECGKFGLSLEKGKDDAFILRF
jgi:poly-gamma-glutamate synthesis protein (capsule biosynthesis protein)